MLIKYLLNGKEINLTSDNISIQSDNFIVDENGKVKIIDEVDENVNDTNANLTIQNKDGTRKNQIIPGRIKLLNNGIEAWIWVTSGWAYIKASSENGNCFCRMISGGPETTFFECTDGINTTTINPKGIETPQLTQTSLESQKKNFEKLEKGLDIVKATDIYKYNFKSENDNDKKHIGFVIGENYKYSKEITSLNKEKEEIGVDLYSMIAVAYKAIQEQQEQIQNLQERIKKLEGGQNEKDNI